MPPLVPSQSTWSTSQSQISESLISSDVSVEPSGPSPKSVGDDECPIVPPSRSAKPASGKYALTVPPSSPSSVGSAPSDQFSVAASDQELGFVGVLVLVYQNFPFAPRQPTEIPLLPGMLVTPAVQQKSLPPATFPMPMS